MNNRDTTLERLDDQGQLTGFRVHLPSGATITYDYMRSNLLGQLEVFMTERKSPTGRATTYHYETTNDVVRLVHFVDASGGTNVLRYHTNFLDRVVGPGKRVSS